MFLTHNSVNIFNETTIKYPLRGLTNVQLFIFKHTIRVYEEKNQKAEVYLLVRFLKDVHVLALNKR